MIHIDTLEIHEFRGIKNLKIDFKGKNFAVCGRNGTGKSGIVDALEFALTGNISRLSGEGTGGISLKDHAPHVDSRNHPEKARVILTVTILSLNKKVTIERNVKDALNPKISPISGNILEVLNQVKLHPEFVLSRRELIKYVISTPGERAKEVQALLRLDKVEGLRSLLQKIANATKKDVPILKREKDNAQTQLTRALEITEFSPAKVLEAVNPRRSLLGVSPLAILSPTTSLRDGLATPLPTQAVRFPKVQAQADIKKAVELIREIESPETNAVLQDVKGKLKELSDDPAVLQGLNRENLLKLAIQLFGDDSCPVCDTPWNPDDFRNLIEAKLKHLDDLTAKRSIAEKTLEPLQSLLIQLRLVVITVESYSILLSKLIETKSLKDYIEAVTLNLMSVHQFTPLLNKVSAIENFSIVPSEVIETIGKIESAINLLPDPSQQDAARDFLTIAQERLETYRSISLRHKKAEEQGNLAASVLAVYAKVSTEVLEGIYKEVEKDFSDLYRLINEEDEGGFSAQLTPSMGKLGFDVDFYGRGFFPPGAYHSEGHQDGMGLCLYLALMKHLLGDAFTFAVLDDVLMSVDTGHRREVCKLLKEKFPQTQFVLTTHDEVWLKHMKTVGLILSKGSIHFRKWDVDSGPTEWSDRDIWAEIDSEMQKNNVSVAAGLLRHYLEFISNEICHQLRAKVEFRGDGQFQLGDLLPSATSQFTKLLKEAESSATSWGKKEEDAAIKARRASLASLITESNLEQWQTNSAMHYNEWANLQGNDFIPVATAFHNLIDAFFCSEPTCQSLLYVLPGRGQREMIRCSCGRTSINLKMKS